MELVGCKMSSRKLLLSPFRQPGGKCRPKSSRVKNRAENKTKLKVNGQDFFKFVGNKIAIDFVYFFLDTF